LRSVGQHSKSSLFYLHLVIWLLEINSLKCRMFYNIDNNEFVADDENYRKKKKNDITLFYNLSPLNKMKFRNQMGIDHLYIFKSNH
jgi:hypothetical protein